MLLPFSASWVRIPPYTVVYVSKWSKVMNACCTNSAPLAQSVEHQTFNLRAAGSSPARGFVIHRTLNDVIWTHSSVVEQLTADQSVPSSNLGGSFVIWSKFK